MSQTSHSFRRKITTTVDCKYLLHLPEGYERGKKRWPLILFLHGAGERGDDLARVKVHGPPKLVESGKRLPFIIVSPQCPADDWWSAEVLGALLDEVERKYRVDKRRVYLTGLSMGGYGTWLLAQKYPERFAAIAPICGAGNPHLAQRIRNLPAWVFHGAKDEVVPISRSREMVEALRKCGSRVKFTVYPNAQHDSWTKTYENPRLYEWFLKHRRGSPARDRFRDADPCCSGGQ